MLALTIKQNNDTRKDPPAGRGGVVCGLSGEVDSAVAAALLHEAIGDQLTCIFVDTGLLRAGEAEEVVSLFRGHYNIPLIHRDAPADCSSKSSPTSPTPKISARRSAGRRLPSCCRCGASA